MAFKQLSVFLENREGRLEDLFASFVENNIDIKSFSLAENSDYGILRLIVSEPDKAKDILKAKDFSASVSEVVAVKLDGGFTSIKELTDAVSSTTNIEYMYVLDTNVNNQSIVFKTNNVSETEELLRSKGFNLIESI